ncbi:MAG: acyltransferase family protein [Acidimicrobiales bacterium]
MRALAALSVIGVHTTFVSGFTGRSGVGNYTSRLEIGVAVFFVISGFLLYRPFAAAHFEDREAPAIGPYLSRRIRRIVPAYWVTFLVVTYVLHADVVRHGWGSLLIYLGFAQIYSPSHVLTGVTQAWSLCTEVTFYLVLPLWAALVGRGRRTAGAQFKVELVGLAGLVAVSFAFRSWALEMHTPLARVMPNWLPAYADLFALGMFLAVASCWLSVSGRKPAVLWHAAFPWASWAAAAVAFVVVSNIGLPWTPVTASHLGLSLARQTLYGVFAFFVVAPAVMGPQDRGLIRRMLRTRPLMAIGVVSYGVYLWHESWITLFLRWTGDRPFAIPLPDLLVPVTVLAIAAASASYLLVERPILRWWRRDLPPATPVTTSPDVPTRSAPAGARLVTGR